MDIDEEYREAIKNDSKLGEIVRRVPKNDQDDFIDKVRSRLDLMNEINRKKIIDAFKEEFLAQYSLGGGL